jgi:hypothetical protein
MWQDEYRPFQFAIPIDVWPRRVPVGSHPCPRLRQRVCCFSGDYMRQFHRLEDGHIVRSAPDGIATQVRNVRNWETDIFGSNDQLMFARGTFHICLRDYLRF